MPRTESPGPRSVDLRQWRAPATSDGSVVVDILQGVAEKTVKQAIVQHQQRGGKQVTAARVRILPGSLRVGNDQNIDGRVPDLVQEFVVRRTQNGDGDESSILEPVGSLTEPQLCSAHGTTSTSSHSAVHPPDVSGIYQGGTPGGYCSRTWSKPFSGEFRFGSGSKNAQYPTFPTPSSTPVYTGTPRSTARLVTGTSCISLPECKQTSLSSSVAGSHSQPMFALPWNMPCCSSCADLLPASPYWVNDSLSTAAPMSDMNSERFPDSYVENLAYSTKLKRLSPDLNNLIKGIIKFATIKSLYEESARAVKAWITRHRCSYGEEATEDLALKRIPQQYEKYRSLHRALDGLQRQLSQRLSSMVLKPIQRLAFNEQEAFSEQPQHSVDKQRKPHLPGLRHLTEQVTRLNAIYMQLQQAAGPAQQRNCSSGKHQTGDTEPGIQLDSNALRLKLCREENTTKSGEDSTGDECGGVSAFEGQDNELVRELHLLSERVTIQQELLRQMNAANQRQVSELIRLKGSHRVLCRIINGVESLGLRSSSAMGSGFVSSEGSTTLKLKGPQATRQNSNRCTGLTPVEAYSFDFDRVYNESATTKDIYLDMKELTASAMCGTTLSIVAFGPPKSGKASTLFFPSEVCGSEGSKRSPTEDGLLAYFLSHLYELLQEKCMLAPQKGSIDAEVRCTCVELHNEVLLDAFDPQPRSTGRMRPEVVKNARTGEVRVTNLKRVACDITGDTSEATKGQTTMVSNIVKEIRAALERRRAAARESHVICTVSFKVVDRDMGEHLAGKMVFAMLAAAANPERKPPFDSSSSIRDAAIFGQSKANVVESTHLTNRAINSLRTIFQARRSATWSVIGDEVFRGSRLTRILEDCLKPPALSVFLLTVRNDSLRISMAKFYAEICATARR